MRRLEVRMYETFTGLDDKQQIVTTSAITVPKDQYASSCAFGRYFLEMIRDLDRQLDRELLRLKEEKNAPPAAISSARKSE